MAVMADSTAISNSRIVNNTTFFKPSTKQGPRKEQTTPEEIMRSCSLTELYELRPKREHLRMRPIMAAERELASICPI